MDTSTTLLGLLGREAGYGYDLKHHYDHWFGARRPIAFGQVYATLVRLIRDGLIEEAGVETGEGPERKRYAITSTGRRKIEAWLFTPDAPKPSLQSNLFAKTIIALMLENDAHRLLDLQRAEHLQRMRELTRLKREGDLRTVLLADHDLFHIEADLRWIELTSARLEALREEVRGCMPS